MTTITMMVMIIVGDFINMEPQQQQQQQQIG